MTPELTLPDADPLQARVLLAEDSAMLRPVLVDLLECEGYEVVATCDGAEAMEAVRTSGPFDAVVTDYVMPRVDGAELVRQLHDTLDTPPPVIVYSAKAPDDGKLPSVLDLPGVHYVWKGYSADRLVDTLREVTLG